MPKVYNMNHVPVPGAIYVGRPTMFGNPYVIGKHGTREEVVRRYEERVRSNPVMLDQIVKQLKGKDLICWCAPNACHADVLLKIANT